MSAPVEQLPITQIVVDDRFQPRRDGLSEDHVAALMETPEDWPPVVVAYCDGSPVLIDGFHRHAAAARLGLETITATAFYPEQGADLFAISFALNIKHGRPLTLRDRKAYAAWLLQYHPELSDRECGRRTGLHHETVGAIRNEQRSIRIPQREPGQLPDDVDLFDRIRYARKASRGQKVVAGYVQRLAIALHDPYNGSLNFWSDDPAVITRSCFVTMGEKRAAKLLAELEADARFILQVAKARNHITKETN